MNRRVMLGRMSGITAALALFLLAGMVWRERITSRAHYYAAFFSLLLIIIIDALARMIHANGFSIFAYVLTAALQVVALIAMLLSVGGMGPKQLTSEMLHAYEVIRRGESEKEIIIPLGGQKPAEKPEPPAPPPTVINTQPRPEGTLPLS